MSLQTHDLGRLFFHMLPRIRPRSPVLRNDPTWEMDPPFRRSSSWVIRLWPFNVGIVLGWWRGTDVETREEQEEAMGMNPRMLGLEEYREVRKQISALGMDPSDELEMLQTMDAM